MENRQKQQVFSLILLCVLLSIISTQTQGTFLSCESSIDLSPDASFQGNNQFVFTTNDTNGASSHPFEFLRRVYTMPPSVVCASRIESSITLRFIDGSYSVLLTPFRDSPRHETDLLEKPTRVRYGEGTAHKALILNPTEYVYGYRHCQRIIAILLKQDYSIEYLANHAVDLNFIRYNLSADIIYMNTHAGYFDVDGDQQADSVVIATGELWTNETEQKYSFDFQNHLIVKGVVGNKVFVAFTPAFIEYYYSDGDLQDSLVFMATCYALYDTSMAEKFLDAGASVYIGWSHNTVFWLNSRTSVNAFRLLSFGLTVQQVCRLIRSGGFYNWVLHSKLIYHGNGSHRIS